MTMTCLWMTMTSLTKTVTGMTYTTTGGTTGAMYGEYAMDGVLGAGSAGEGQLTLTRIINETYNHAMEGVVVIRPDPANWTITLDINTFILMCVTIGLLTMALAC